jgi:hypothetical protein
MESVGSFRNKHVMRYKLQSFESFVKCLIKILIVLIMQPIGLIPAEFLFYYLYPIKYIL